MFCKNNNKSSTEITKIHSNICNPPGSTLPQLVGARLEPGIPVREAGALTSKAKGYSL